MPALKSLSLFFGALLLVHANTAFAEEVGYKSWSSHEIQQSLADEEICSDLDITNKNKLSTCLQRKYVSVKSDLDSTYSKLVADPEKDQNTTLSSKKENEINQILSLFKKKPAEIKGFVEEKDFNAIAQNRKKKDELIKEQAAWDEKLLYHCMEAANEIKNDPYPLLVIKGCLVSKTEERLAYLNGMR